MNKGPRHRGVKNHRHPGNSKKLCAWTIQRWRGEEAGRERHGQVTRLPTLYPEACLLFWRTGAHRRPKLLHIWWWAIITKQIKQQMSVEMPEKPHPLSLNIETFSRGREMRTESGLKAQGPLQHRVVLLHPAVLFISSKSLSGYPLKTALPRAFYWPYSSATYRACKPNFSTKATQRMFFLHSWYFDNFSRMQIYSRPKSICIAINWECNVAAI